MNKQHIKTLIAEGKLEQAVTELVDWTKISTDKDANKSIVLLSQRHNTNEQSNHLGNISQSDYLMERNRISLALLVVIENTDSEKNVLTLVKRLNWVGIGVFLIGLIAFVANIGTIKDAFFKEEVKTISQPTETQKVASEPIAVPDKPKETAKSTPPPMTGKNNTLINVKDHGKVGTVITGDSNKIDIKQDF